MAAEIRRLFPVLLLPGPGAAVEVAAPGDVGWRVWGQGKELRVLVVNSGSAPAEAVLSLPGTPEAVSCELGEGTGQAAGRQLTVALAPMEPRLLRVTLAP
jgi:hypothetical protein